MAGPNLDAWNLVISQVSVPTKCTQLEFAAREYQVVFENMTRIQQRLTDLATKAAENWTGQGGQAFQAYIHALARSMEQNIKLHVDVVAGLGRLSGHVKTAVINIPVYHERVPEVRANPAFNGRPIPDDLRPAPWPGPHPGDEILERWHQHFRVWAERTRQALATVYEQEAQRLPKGERLTPPRVNVPGGGPGTGPGTRRPDTGPGNGPGTGPGADGLGAGALPSSQMQTPSFGGTTPNTQVPSVQPPEQPEFTPPKVDIPTTPDVEIPESPDFGLAGVPGGGGGFGGGGGLPVAEAPAATTSGFGGGGGGARGVTVPGAGGGAANAGPGMYPPPMYPPHGGGAGQGQAGGRNDDLVREHEVRVVFGFETDQSDDPELPRSGVLSA